MDLFRQVEKEYYSRKEHQSNMDLFRQAEKEYLDQSNIKAVNQQSNIEACEQQLCFEGRKHQFINLSGVMTCDSCGLETYPFFVSGYNCWDTAIPRGQDKSSISCRYENFCYKGNITDFVLSGKEKYEIVKNIKKVYDAEEPKRRTLPNLNILTYQICKRLDIEMDETLLKIPKSRASHNR
jgi:hypothetical protein